MGHYMVVRTGLVRVSVQVAGLFLLMLALDGALGQVGDVASDAGLEVGNISYSRLSLDVYLDQTGKALVTGYASAKEGLTFLHSSQYSYENDTGQLYALTNSLTWKSGDLWRVQLATDGYYDEYAATFYLPANSKLGNINRTDGLQHLISASNDSFVISVQGFEVTDPVTSIEYRQALQETAATRDSSPLYLLAGLLLILGAAGGAALIRRRGLRPSSRAEAGGESLASRGEPIDSLPRARPSASGVTAGGTAHGPGASLPGEGEGTEQGAPTAASGQAPARASASMPEASAAGGAVGEQEASSGVGAAEMSREPADLDAGEGVIGREDEDAGAAGEAGGEWEAGQGTPAREGRAPLSGTEKIEITSEMAAVMETLTPRERKVIKAVIESNGRITQAEIRYQTGIPKSSLTGILLSLERRKLVTKRGWGRTNVVELSEWFRSQKTES
ncbi:MAG: helix-turn-helix domain-containing protein [Methanosarcinales archaeon]|nr:helix-turn-helix domain-containing protein [Methanosarcinales archaeon]